MTTKVRRKNSGAKSAAPAEKRPRKNQPPPETEEGLPIVRLEGPRIDPDDPRIDKPVGTESVTQWDADSVALAKMKRVRAPMHTQFFDALTPPDDIAAMRELPPPTQAEREISARSLRSRMVTVLAMKPEDREVLRLKRCALEVPEALLAGGFAIGYQVSEFVPALEYMHGKDTDGARWLWSMLLNGMPAIRDACAEMVMHRDLAALETNTLSAIGNMVSVAIRQRILLETLDAEEWNMARVASRLRMGYGSAPVLRAIKELGLTEEYEEAKREGLIKVGGARKKLPG